ncbi:hypothetical protein KAS14_00605 [Candidatus Bathyarchaeota archaeon]|nr:hypothetical protein [Candidatus Bathyarchaeota archaeon]
MENLHSQLNECKDLPDVFEVVKKTVEGFLCQRRAGLMLGLGDLPLSVAAFYVVASNIIVMNENLYYKVLEEYPDRVNTWSFRVLLHEYLHSLGYQYESEVRKLVHEISAGLLERIDLSTGSMGYRLHYFPPSGRYRDRRSIHLSDFKIRLVKGFDRSSTRYIA